MDGTKLYPNEQHEVLCMKCLKVDSTRRGGRNHLLGCQAHGLPEEKRLYIHLDCLSGMESGRFEILLAHRMCDADLGLVPEH